MLLHQAPHGFKRGISVARLPNEALELEEHTPSASGGSIQDSENPGGRGRKVGYLTMKHGGISDGK